MFLFVKKVLVNHLSTGSKFILLSLLILFFICLNVGSQVVYNNSKVTVNVKDMPLREVLSVIEQQVPYKFAYNTDLIAKHKHLNIYAENKSLEEVFLIVLDGTNITYSIIDNQIILSERPPPAKITLSGYIKDSISGETLPGAIIYFPERESGTYANNYGFFSTTQNQADSLEILISYMGFNKVSRKVNALQSSSSNFFLTNNNVELNTVLITNSRADDDIKNNHSGKTEISMDRVRAMPGISGTGDIINTIQMMPGVLAGLDGRPGYFIRGGNTDQNLVQLDEATLYNPNHLLGLLGIFNSSAIKSAYLMKAGFPASFGDHLSSVLDVTMKEGNEQRFDGDLQLGTVTSGFTLSGPIAVNKASFFVAARRSTIDLLLKPMNVENYYSNYYFYDVNAKLNFKVTQKDRLFLSFYQGRDYSSYIRDTINQNDINYQVDYGNRALTLRWNHLFSQKLFSNTSLTYNSYYHRVKAKQQQFYAELYSGIRDIELKTDFNYYPNENHKISAGVNYLFQTLYPASVTDKSIVEEPVTTIEPEEIPQKISNRVAAYISDEITLGSRFSAYIGARIPFFYSKDAKFLQFEPRVSLMYLINPTSSIKISYTQMHQYLHLVQSFNASFPAQIWIGSNKIVKPQNCQETSIGLFKHFKDNMFRTSFEIYYKKLGNQLLFRGGSNPEIKSDMESTLIFGKGQSYGAELFFGKNTGKLTGFMAYTLSYARQNFDSLNLGRQFPFSNDRRHSLYLSANYNIGEHWEVSSNFLFTSGSAFSLFENIPPNKWQYDNPLFYYSGGSNAGSKISSTQIVQNNYRLKPYNRLDLSVSYRKSKNLFNRVVETEWVFSVYNVYGRENTFFAYCSIDPVTKRPIAVEVSFVPVIPSLSFNVKF